MTFGGIAAMIAKKLNALNSKGLRLAPFVDLQKYREKAECPEFKGIKTLPLHAPRVALSKKLNALNSKGLRPTDCRVHAPVLKKLNALNSKGLRQKTG